MATNMSKMFVASTYLQNWFGTSSWPGAWWFRGTARHKIPTQNQNTNQLQMRSHSRLTCHYHSYSDTRFYIARRQTRHSYPQHSLHTASCQTRMPGRHQRNIFAPPIGTATPNTVDTQQLAKPPCQEDITFSRSSEYCAADRQDINAKFSYLLLAQLPPNPHARKTPTQHFRTSYWHTYPKHSLHTATSQTPMPGRHHLF